ncbi:NUMOD4 domain-containing protein [Streptomyces sp. NPDC005813]|uniref:NUMOD4 domain-containing protein n=1 Tax=Streptomyces sp. NPDC005813 TaxID=3155592 RepID=UPI0033EBF27A
MSEEWRAVPGWSGYFVSDEGRVRGKSGRILKPWSNGTGYVQVSLLRPGRRRTVSVHRLVLEVFVGAGRALQGAHGNGDSTDNRLANLRWSTPAENNADKLTHGTQVRGEASNLARLKEADVRDIRKRVTAGETQRTLAAEYGVHFATVSAIVRRKSWGHVA